MARIKNIRFIIIGIIIFVLAAGGITAGIIFSGNSKKLLLSRPGLSGNTAGNLYNMGMFCENDGRIYFSNYLDDGTLYSMSTDLTDYVKINDDCPRYINVDDNYIYYSRMNNLKAARSESVFIFYANGVYRQLKNGKNQVMLHNKAVGSLFVYDNKVFYQNYVQGEKLSIRKTDIDAKNESEFINDESVAVAAYDGRIYYNGFTSDHYLHSKSATGGNDKVEIEQNVYNAIVRDEGIYFIDTLDHYRLKLYKNGDIKTLVNKKISAYNITEDGHYIYYQVDGTKEDGVYCYNVLKDESTLIKDGNYKWLNIAGGYCFFYSSDTSTVFAYGQGKGLSIFNPQVLSGK